MQDNKIVSYEFDSMEFRAFFRVDAETETVATTNVWRAGVGLLGRPPQALLLGIHFYTDAEGENRSMNLNFDIDQARALHRALGELLDHIE